MDDQEETRRERERERERVFSRRAIKSREWKSIRQGTDRGDATP
jgi:hypothetical protein